MKCILTIVIVLRPDHSARRDSTKLNSTELSWVESGRESDHTESGDHAKNWVVTQFLPARRYASAGNSDRNVSVRPSVRLSVIGGIVSKRRKELAAWFLHHLVAPRLYFSDAKFHHQILRVSHRTGASNKGRSEKFSDFLASSVNISKTVADTAKVTISD